MNHRQQLRRVDMKSTCRKLRRQPCITCGACSLSVSISPQHTAVLLAASAELYGNQAIWKPGYMETRLYGNQAIWKPGYRGTRL